VKQTAKDAEPDGANRWVPQLAGRVRATARDGTPVITMASARSEAAGRDLGRPASGDARGNQ
jgi:hypothetical protein